MSLVFSYNNLMINKFKNNLVVRLAVCIGIGTFYATLLSAGLNHFFPELILYIGYEYFRIIFFASIPIISGLMWRVTKETHEA